MDTESSEDSSVSSLSQVSRRVLNLERRLVRLEAIIYPFIHCLSVWASLKNSIVWPRAISLAPLLWLARLSLKQHLVALSLISLRTVFRRVNSILTSRPWAEFRVRL